MAYNPNQAGLFNRLIQSGLNTANAALQAGITSTKDFALGDNGNLGGLIPGANAVPATAQSVFQSVRFAETASGQPTQMAAAAIGAAPLFTPQTFEIPPAPVTGLDLAAPSPTQFSLADPRVSSSIPNPVIVTTSDAARDAAISASRPGYDQAPPITDPNAAGIRPQDVGPANSAPAPQLVPTQTLDPATAQQALATAPEVVTAAQLGSQTFPSTVNPALTASAAPVDEFTGIDQQVAANTARNAENQSNAETARLNNANQQAAIQSTFKQPGNGDWRFRISLAQNSNYLYSIINNSEKGGGAGAANSGPGILAPLANTGGVIFPYTPSVTSSYQARYNTYELVHSNHRGAFYQSSFVGDINIRGVFTAQDTTEAAYMLAVIHFFRSVTKMFYGQDAQRGAPPPLVFLTGLGDYQYNRHPAVVTQFDYTLPNDVDYIRATNPNNFGTDLLNRRTPTAASPVKSISAIGTRLLNALLTPGAESAPPSRAAITNSVTNTARATYVPTKIEISVTLMPMQTRDQVSKQFSLEKFANGSLLSGGFW